MTPRRSTLAGIAALLLACGGDPAGAPSALRFCALRLEAYYGQLAACVGAPPAQVEAWRSSAGALCSAIDREVSAGRVRYDAARGEGCLLAAAGQDCAGVVIAERRAPLGALAVPGCEGAIKGAVEPGSACYDDVDCAESACTTTLTLSGPGTCSPFAAAGASCLERACGPGLACLYDGSGAAACTMAGGAGEPCPCAPGLRCDAGVCRALAEGGPCTFTAECASGLVCAGAPRTCQLHGGEGSPCTFEASRCAPGLQCDPLAGACTPAPRLGQRCVVKQGITTFTLKCLDGYCDAGRSGSCRARKADGEPCERESDPACQGHCDARSRTCDGGAGLASTPR